MTRDLGHEFLEFIERHSKTPLRPLAAAVLEECRKLTDAEAGTIFIVRREGRSARLEALSLQNDRIRAKSAMFLIPLDRESVAGYVAATGETVLIDDVDRIDPQYPFQFNRSFDRKTGYHTHSMMCFPLTTSDDTVIGVVQLINSLGLAAGGGARLPIAFDPAYRGMVAPVSLIVGRAIERVAALEEIARRNKRLAEQNRALRQERQRVVKLGAATEEAFKMSVELLARAAEVHDESTGNHILRVNEYSYALARLVRQPKAYCDEIRWAAALHDVGKMSVDMAVLKKKGKLDEREWQEMRAHSSYGHAILAGHPRLAMAAEIAYAHHEMWAGTGYPRGLKGEEIPLSARIVAMADVYDALRSDRPYKAGFDHATAVKIMTCGDERINPVKHFDPNLLATFERYNADFAAIWDRLSIQDATQQRAAVA